MNKHSYLALSLLVSVTVLTACNQSDIEKQVQPQKGKEPTNQQEQPSSGQQTKQQDSTKDKTKQPTGEDGKPKKTKEQLIKEKLDFQEKQIRELTDEVEYYRTFIKDFTATFTTEKMNEFIQKEWSYKLLLNNINFPKNGVLELSDNTFDLVVTEDRVPYSVIPDEMSLQGRIEGGIQEKVSFASEIENQVKEDITEKNSVITYSFKDVPSGTTIKLSIPETLQKELNLDTTELEIRVQ